MWRVSRLSTCLCQSVLAWPPSRPGITRTPATCSPPAGSIKLDTYTVRDWARLRSQQSPNSSRSCPRHGPLAALLRPAYTFALLLRSCTQARKILSHSAVLCAIKRRLEHGQNSPGPVLLSTLAEIFGCFEHRASDHACRQPGFPHPVALRHSSPAGSAQSSRHQPTRQNRIFNLPTPSFLELSGRILVKTSQTPYQSKVASPSSSSRKASTISCWLHTPVSAAKRSAASRH